MHAIKCVVRFWLDYLVAQRTHPRYCTSVAACELRACFKVGELFAAALALRGRAQSIKACFMTFGAAVRANGPALSGYLNAAVSAVVPGVLDALGLVIARLTAILH